MRHGFLQELRKFVHITMSLSKKKIEVELMRREWIIYPRSRVDSLKSNFSYLKHVEKDNEWQMRVGFKI